MRVISLVVSLAICQIASAQKTEPKYEGKPLAFWVERLQKVENNADRTAAIEAICAFGADGAAAVPALLVMFDDRSPVYRARATRMLCAIGPGAKGAVPDLIKMLEVKAPRDPDSVLLILSSIGPAAKDAIPAIRRMVLDYLAAKLTEEGSAFGPLDNLSKLHKLGPDVVPLFLEIIETPGGTSWGLRLLQKDKPDAKRLTPALIKLLKHDLPLVRLEAALSLWNYYGDASGVPVLTALLKENNYAISTPAAQTLGNMGLHAKEALPALRAILPKDYDAVVGTGCVVPLTAPYGSVPDISDLHRVVKAAIQQIAPAPEKMMTVK